MNPSPECTGVTSTENNREGFRFCACGYSVVQGKSAFNYPRGLEDAIAEHLNPAGFGSAAGEGAARIAPAVRAVQGGRA